jgi:cell division protein FtsB
MANYKHNLSEEINEVLEFMAGEGDGDVPYQLRKEKVESELNEVKRLLVYIVQEITVLRYNIIKGNTDHRDKLTDNKDLRDSLTKENEALRDSIMAKKEEIKDLKSQISESN